MKASEVSEELSSVETSISHYLFYFIHCVSEELSSVETWRKVEIKSPPRARFQKNLVVWKLIFKVSLSLFRKSFQKNLVVWKLQTGVIKPPYIFSVSEELSSVETVGTIPLSMSTSMVSEELSSVETRLG